MKRVGNINGVKLYDVICSEDNIREAINLACKDHAHDPAVKRIKEDPEPYVAAIKEILTNESFHYTKFKEKDIFERGKQRHLVFSKTFPDRIIQHCVFNVVAPILHSTIVPDEYAAIKGRGTHRCSAKVYDALKYDPIGTRYCLKLDIKKFFDNIDRDILFDQIKDKIKCHRTLDILHTMIYDVPGEKGLPIGLYSSQILSVFYLSSLDHYCKEVLRIHYYFRYMDDIVILSNSKDVLRAYMMYMRDFVSKLGMEFKSNWAIFPTAKRKVDFVGFAMDRNVKRVRRRTVLSYKRVCFDILWMISKHIPLTTHIIASKQSYEGIFVWVSDKHLIDMMDARIWAPYSF